MELLFYPIDVDYEITSEGPAIYLYGKTKDGKQVCVVDYFQPYFYVENDKDVRYLLENLTAVQGDKTFTIAGLELVEKVFLGKTKELYKVFTGVPKAVPLLKEAAEKLGLQCYEYDILFTYRYLIDKQIKPMTLVKVEGSFSGDTFIAESVEQASGTFDDAKILAIDIETYAKEKVINPSKNPILMVALYGNYKGKELKKVITWKRFPDSQDVEFVGSEKELLQRLVGVIKNYEPDIITGYYSDGFDMPYIETRAKKHRVSLDIGRDRSVMKVRNKEAKIVGIPHVDVYKFVRYIIWRGLKTDVYGLDPVAQELLGIGKHDVNLDDLADAWDSGSDSLREFAEYNLQDSLVTFKLCEKLLPDMIEFVKLVGLPLHDFNRSRFSKLVELYLLRRGVEFNILAPNKPGYQQISGRKNQHYEGGFVYQPEPGVYSDLVVFDFRSLYPSIITSHNVDISTLNCSCCSGDGEKWFCQKVKGFLPTVVEDLIIRRSRIKELIKKSEGDVQLLQARSEALKIMTNSFYGYLGFFGARWYSIDCASSVTGLARRYITSVISKAKKAGFSVIYGDTDSIFLSLEGKSKEEALEFVTSYNDTLTGQMELEFEGYYPKGIFVSLKGNDIGAKKKYALLNEDGAIMVKGFESVRRNWSEISKEVQKKVLKLVLDGLENVAVEYIKSVIDDLRAQNVSVEKLILKTQLTKPVEQYDSIGPHVAVALQMIEKGQSVGPGSLIMYVIGKGSGVIRDRAKLPEEVVEYDSEYYVKNQVVPAVSTIMQVFGYSSDDFLKDKKQQGLDAFF